MNSRGKMTRRILLISSLVLLSFPFPGQSQPQKALESSAPPPSLKLGVQALFAGEYAKAEAIAQQQLKIAPRSADALVLLARVQMAQGKYSLAFGTLRKALSNAPGHIEALYFMGKLSGALSQMEYQKLAQLAPDGTRLHQLMGDGFQASGELDKAEAEYRAALSGQPDNTEVGLELGDMLRTRQKYEEALQVYSKVLENKPLEFWALFGSGMCHQGLQQFSQAAVFFQKACDVLPDNALSRLALGNIQLKNGETEKAAASLKMAANLDPSLRDAYTLMGKALQLSGQPEQAAKAFEEAQKLLQLELEQRRIKFRTAFGMEISGPAQNAQPH
jgi:Tfp pilus assembly protein PilF